MELKVQEVEDCFECPSLALSNTWHLAVPAWVEPSMTSRDQRCVRCLCTCVRMLLAGVPCTCDVQPRTHDMKISYLIQLGIDPMSASNYSRGPI